MVCSFLVHPIFASIQRKVKTIFDAIYNSDLKRIKSSKFNNHKVLNIREGGVVPLGYAEHLGEYGIVNWFINKVVDRYE